MPDQAVPARQPYPSFVRTDEDRERWDAAVRAAAAALDEPEDSEATWMAARVLYRDRALEIGE